MSSRRHRKGCIGADSLYKQEFLSYIVFSCLPVGTRRVVSMKKLMLLNYKGVILGGNGSITGGVDK